MKNSDEQAELLSQYWAALGENPAAPPPPGLDPADADLARRLRLAVRAPQARPAFRAQLLRQQLAEQAKLQKSPPDTRAAGRLEAETPSTGRRLQLPPLGSLFGRLATAVVLVALLLGSIAVATDLIRRQQLQLATQATPTPTIVPTAVPTAIPTPCSGPLASWLAAAPLAPGVPTGAAASDGTYVYMAGGAVTLSGLNESNQLLRYDLATRKWTTLAPAPVPFAAATAVYSPINKKLYVFGGAHGPNALASVPFSDTRIYNPTTNSWSSGAPMSDTRLLMAAGYWNGKIYLVGGIATLAASSVAAQTWEYDPLANTWATRTPLPTRGSGFSYGVINGHLYVAGGFDPTTGGFTNATYDYDIAADRWTVRAKLPIAINYAGSAVVGSHLYVFGGIDNNTAYQSQTYVYDPASDTWSNGPNMAQGRMLPASASVGNNIVAVGGSNSGGLLTAVEATTVSCQAVPSPSPDTPTPPPTPLSRS